MTNSIVIKKKLKNFNKKIVVSADKSISIRWVLFASLASGNSKAVNLLISEDVKAAIKTVRKLGIKNPRISLPNVPEFSALRVKFLL